MAKCTTRVICGLKIQYYYNEKYLILFIENAFKQCTPFLNLDEFFFHPTTLPKIIQKTQNILTRVLGLDCQYKYFIVL